MKGISIQLDFGLALILASGLWLNLIDIYFALFVYAAFTAFFTAFAFVVLKVVGVKVAKLLERGK